LFYEELHVTDQHPTTTAPAAAAAAAVRVVDMASGQSTSLRSLITAHAYVEVGRQKLLPPAKYY